MKKFGTPMRAGPGVEREKVGFVVAGEPVAASVGVDVTSGATVVFTGEAKGLGAAVCDGAAVALVVGAAVAVPAGGEPVVALGAVVAAMVALGVAAGVPSSPDASAPSDAANRAAPARPVARMRRVKMGSERRSRRRHPSPEAGCLDRLRHRRCPS
jgi:hypothetical protein